jgi:hypothetical protein
MVGCSAALSRRALNDNTLSADTLMTTKPQLDSSTAGPHCPARQLLQLSPAAGDTSRHLRPAPCTSSAVRPPRHHTSTAGGTTHQCTALGPLNSCRSQRRTPHTKRSQPVAAGTLTRYTRTQLAASACWLPAAAMPPSSHSSPTLTQPASAASLLCASAPSPGPSLTPAVRTATPHPPAHHMLPNRLRHFGLSGKSGL